MVNLKVTVGTETLPIQGNISIYLSNTLTGPRMRSPWPCVILDLTTEQATELAKNLLAGCAINEEPLT